MRLFIAISLNDEIRKALVQVQDDLSQQGVRGSRVSAENLHMTLAFVGEYPDPGRVLDTMRNLQFSALPVTLNGIGLFNHNVLWAGVREPDLLRQLAEHVRFGLAEADIPFDRKAFTPHITLFRKADGGRGLPEIRIPEASMAVDSISLFRSDRGGNGMVYTEIGSVGAVDSAGRNSSDRGQVKNNGSAAGTGGCLL